MMLGAAELLGNGVTTTCEQYRHPAPVVEAVLDAGIRAVYTPAIFDVPDAGPGSTWEALLAGACAAVRRRWRARRSGCRWASARMPPTPCRPRGCGPSPPRPERATRCCRSISPRREAECAVVRERYGMSAPALLASDGVLEGRVLAAHAVWLDDADLTLLAEHDVAVAHCPGSNGKLGSGIAPLRALLERGVRVGLGTDGPASNDDLHLWDEMRLAAAPGPGHRRRSGRRELGGGAAPGHPRRRRGARPPGGRARGRAAGRRHPPAHRRPPLHPGAERRRAAGPPGVGGRRLPGDRRLGGRRRRSSRRAAAPRVDGDRARAEVGQRARRLLGS